MARTRILAVKRRLRDLVYFRSRNRKVDFVVGGAQKAGTTALDHYLRLHPGLSLPTDVKEVRFFDKDKYFTLDKPDYSIYHGYFDRSRLFAKMLGEVSPVYMYWRESPERIYEYNPGMKWIILLRNPIERAFSHWNMERFRGRESRTFSEALSSEMHANQSELEAAQSRLGYIERGMYSVQLRRIYRFFAAEQVHVEKSEDLKSDPSSVLRRVYEFLGVAPVECSDKRVVHSLSYAERLGAREAGLLKKIYQEDIKRLEEMLKWDCNDWLDSV